MNKKVEQSINDQINEEMFSAYLYLSMAAYADSESLPGVASWFKAQAQEEMVHAMKFYSFQNERGGKVTLKAIKEPETKFSSVLELFEKSLGHEKHITSKINELYEIARNEKDYAFESFLKWFIDEQVEEEDNVGTIAEKIKKFGLEKNTEKLYMLDKELGERVFNASPKEE